MRDLDFQGLSGAAEAAFKPHFADVVRRAARRRQRHRAAGATLAVLAVAAGGTAVALPGGDAPVGGVGVEQSPTPPFIPTPDGSPAPGGQRQDGRAPTGPMVVGDLDHLYVRWHDCAAANDCALKVAATVDGGSTWQNYPLPVGRNALVELRAVAPRTLLAWSQSDGEARQTWHASTDGGATWREVTPRTVAAIPTGWRIPEGFEFLGEGIRAVDPATGDLVILRRNALMLAKPVGGLPASAGLWVSGYTGVADPQQDGAVAGPLLGTGSAVEVSRDGGRTWHRHVFAENLQAHERNPGGAAIATADGQTVYAVGRVGTTLRIYQSVDGGQTWRRAAAQPTLSAGRIAAAVGPDGRLVVQVGPEGSAPPALFESTDGGATVRQITAGPGASAVQVPGGYAQSGWPWSSGAWLSADGTQWSFVSPPTVP